MTATKKSTTSNTASKVKKVESPPVVEVDITPAVKVEVAEGLTASVSNSLREKAGIIFSNQKDVRLVALDMAVELFISNQEKPVTSKTSIKLTKQLVKTRLEDSGCNSIEVEHLNSEGEMIKTQVDSADFNALLNNVFTFTRLVAISAKCIEQKVEDNEVQFDQQKLKQKAIKMLNRLCRSETSHTKVEMVSGEETKDITTSYHFNLEYKPIKDFIRIVFSDKAKIPYGKKYTLTNEEPRQDRKSFFAISAGAKHEDVASLVGNVISKINSSDSSSCMIHYKLKSEVQKDSGTKRFDNLVSWLESESSIESVIEKLLKQYPDTKIELLNELAIAAG